METFLSLSGSLHFRKTAEERFITPSAVSRQIKRLEEETGQKLLYRYRHRTALTEEGEVFAQFCRESLMRYKNLQSQWGSVSYPLKGKLRLFCSVTAAYSVIRKYIKDFKELYPDVNLVVVTGSVDSAISRIQKNEADIAIAVEPDMLPDNISSLLLQATPIRVVAPVEPLFSRSLIKNYRWEKSRIPWILPERGFGRKHINKWLKEQNIRPEIIAETSGNEATIAMVSMGFGIGMVSDLVLNNSPFRDTVEVVETDFPIDPFRVILTAGKSRLEEPVVQAFWNLLNRKNCGRDLQ